MEKNEFINKIAPIVVVENEKRGNPLFSSVIIAQAILETGYGTSMLMMNANAVFGRKASDTYQGKVYSSRTREVYNNNSILITSKFRAYDSLVESVSDYFDLICKSSRYRKALTAETPEQCIRAIINGGYATDPNYVWKITKLIEVNDLTKYDVARETYQIGKNYITKVNLNVRTAPGIDSPIKKYEELTEDGKKHSLKGVLAILNKGTTVTVKDIQLDIEGNTWLKIPSGYICAVYKGNVYVS